MLKVYLSKQRYQALDCLPDNYAHDKRGTHQVLGHKGESVRTIAAILFILLQVVGLDARTAQAQSGVVTFKFTNTTPYKILVKFYSQDRNHVWPSSSSHYVLDDSIQRVSRLGCQVGEKICYGASYGENSSSYWGMGYRGDKDCQGCCLRCGTMSENRWYAWRLNE